MIGAQINFLDEITVDNFAGGGGASTGIELALGRPVDIAINHDPDAILLHKTNHPYTQHLQASVWDVDPVEVCAGRPVGLAWFSPDCKHFSKAKGAALLDRKIRGLAWIALRWAGTVRPRVIMLENVEEFQTWGPVRKGKPVKKKAGQTFRKFIKQLSDLGYHIEYRELVAADYGAPTTRKRFVLVARCDGKPIVWPKPTHSHKDSEEVKNGMLLPWRSAAEVIDWRLPGYSIFASKEEIKAQYGVIAQRPLAKNTLRRVIRGVDKFTIQSGRPFIVECNHGGERGAQSTDRPVNTLTAKYTGGICRPILAPLTATNTSNSVGAPAGEPVHTVTTAGNPLDISTPLHTVTARDREALTFAHIAEFKGQDVGQAPDRPLRTITAYGGQFGECRTIIKKADGEGWGFWPQIRALLNEHCGYSLADDEIILLQIGTVFYYIADITLRMLSPRELYNAMGFPPDYEIERDYTGKPYPKNKQVARCGNAVCPPLAEAMVRANLSEWCCEKITTMRQLENAIALCFLDSLKALEQQERRP